MRPAFKCSELNILAGHAVCSPYLSVMTRTRTDVPDIYSYNVMPTTSCLYVDRRVKICFTVELVSHCVHQIAHVIGLVAGCLDAGGSSARKLGTSLSAELSYSKVWSGQKYAPLHISGAVDASFGLGGLTMKPAAESPYR